MRLTLYAARLSDGNLSVPPQCTSYCNIDVHLVRLVFLVESSDRSALRSLQVGAAVVLVKPTARRGPHVETLLQQYLDRSGIPAARIEAKLRERLEGRAPSRQQFARWRLGRVDVRRKDMVRILWAVRATSGNPTVRIEDIFDLDPGAELNWLD